MFINSALKSTEKMLKKTFETGISEEEYYVLLFLLYDYMSDENLAIVMENLTKKSKWAIQNDIAVSINKNFSREIIMSIEDRLNANGFKEWKCEE